MTRLRVWLEQHGHAVLDTGMARSALAGKGMSMSPSVQLRGRVNRVDSGAGPPVDERRVKRP